MTGLAGTSPVSPSTTMVDWLSTKAFPVWTSVGWDQKSSSFIERLDSHGHALPDLPRRVMVQARQIFSCCVAFRRDWSTEAGGLIEPAVASMLRNYFGADGSPGWVFSLDRDGRVCDERRDLYAHAFVLLALATAARVTNNRRLIVIANDTLHFLDERMIAPHGGYRDVMPEPQDGMLRQNPHMHLLEALLALHEVAPEGDYLDRAGRIIDLLTSRFLQGPQSVLVEYFDRDWTPRGGPDFTFEPGHHFEWVWLLSRFRDLSGRAGPAIGRHLWTVASTMGTGEDGTIFDEASPLRGPVQRSTRLWPYTERAKAACCSSATGSSDEAEKALGQLHARFLSPAAPGAWIDHYDEVGGRKSQGSPASSLYHICCAVDEVVRYTSSKAAEDGVVAAGTL